MLRKFEALGPGDSKWHSGLTGGVERSSRGCRVEGLAAGSLSKKKSIRNVHGAKKSMGNCAFIPSCIFLNSEPTINQPPFAIKKIPLNPSRHNNLCLSSDCIRNLKIPLKLGRLHV